VDDPLPPDKLLDLYKIALDEYRFVVRLGWDRTTYFLVLNTAVLTVATGLLKLQNPPAVYLFIALLFLLGCGTSAIGAMSITQGHEYYRRAVVTKTLIEKCLRLTDPIPDAHASLRLAIATTRGQGDHVSILSDPESWIARKLRPSTITYRLRMLLGALAIVDLIGAITSVFMMIYGLGTRPFLAT
jgi:hypothetical protein